MNLIHFTLLFCLAVQATLVFRLISYYVQRGWYERECMYALLLFRAFVEERVDSVSWIEINE